MNDQFYVKFLVRSDDQPEQVYGWFGVYYQRLSTGEVVQTTPGGAEVKFYDWDVYAYIAADDHVTGVSPRAFHGGQLDARMKKYKEFYADKPLMVEIVAAAQELSDKARTMFDAHRDELEERRMALYAQIAELESYVGMIDDFQWAQAVQQELAAAGAPPEYFDLRLREMQAVYGDRRYLTESAVDVLHDDIDAVQQGRTTWEFLLEHARREVNGG